MKKLLILILIYLPFYAYADLFTDSAPIDFKYLNNRSSTSVFTMQDSNKYPCIYYKISDGNLQSVCETDGTQGFNFQDPSNHVLEIALIYGGRGFFYLLDTSWSKNYCYYSINKKENTCALSRQELNEILYPPIDENLP